LVRTDAAGIATAWLFSGSYRFSTPDPVSWTGHVYSWDLIVPVQPGMSAVKLEPDNATQVDGLAPPGARPAPVTDNRSGRPDRVH